MKKIHSVTMILVVLLIMAVASDWDPVWKIIVGGAAVYDLALIAVKLLKKEK